MICGTELCRNLITKAAEKMGAVRRQDEESGGGVTEEEKKAAKDLMPNPCLLIVDEAHSLAKSDTLTSKALANLT